MEVIFSLFLFLLAGLFLGLIAGLLPGIHSNTIAVIALSLSLSNSLGLELSVMLMSMSIMQSFIDFIPSIFLGIPKEESFISLLPGQRMLLKGKGLHALNLVIQGSFFGGLIATILIGLFYLFLIKSEKIISMLIPFILVFALTTMILNEKTLKQKINAILIMTLSAVLGLIVLNNNLIFQPLFALISGFFGVSAALISINTSKIKLKQKIKTEKISVLLTIKAIFLGMISGFIVSVTPSITGNGAALIVKEISGKITTSLYLMIIGATNTVNYILSFIVLLALGKTRTGTAVAMKHLFSFSEKHLLLIIAVCLISLAISAITAKIMGKTILKHLQDIELKKINYFVLAFLIVLCIVFSGIMGLIAMLTATSIALLGMQLKVNRSNCMAFLIVPVLLNLLM